MPVAVSQSIHREEYAPDMAMMFFCESALEAQRAGTRAAANKSENKTIGPLLSRATCDG